MSRYTILVDENPAPRKKREAYTVDMPRIGGSVHGSDYNYRKQYLGTPVYDPTLKISPDDYQDQDYLEYRYQKELQMRREEQRLYMAQLRQALTPIGAMG